MWDVHWLWLLMCFLNIVPNQVTLSCIYRIHKSLNSILISHAEVLHLCRNQINFCFSTEKAMIKVGISLKENACLSFRRYGQEQCSGSNKNVLMGLGIGVWALINNCFSYWSFQWRMVFQEIDFRIILYSRRKCVAVHVAF